jgi:hypothetical protein
MLRPRDALPCTAPLTTYNDQSMVELSTWMTSVCCPMTYSCLLCTLALRCVTVLTSASADVFPLLAFVLTMWKEKSSSPTSFLTALCHISILVIKLPSKQWWYLLEQFLNVHRYAARADGHDGKRSIPRLSNVSQVENVRIHNLHLPAQLVLLRQLQIRRKRLAVLDRARQQRQQHCDLVRKSSSHCALACFGNLAALKLASSSDASGLSEGCVNAWLAYPSNAVYWTMLATYSTIFS